MKLINADALMKDLYHIAIETDGNSMWNSGCWVRYKVVEQVIQGQPSAIYGYSFEQLDLIARILMKEGLPPQRVKEALTDIERIIGIINHEFEESLRRSLDECFRLK